MLPTAEILCGYEVLEELGRSAFARVVRARRAAGSIEVALKVIETGAERARNAARLRNEIELAARLSHPNVTRLVDHGQAEGGLLYAAFDLVAGQDLAALLEAEGPLSPAEACHLMAQVLDALGCAHRLGIVHRDLKPANILVSTTGLRRNALVADFGLGALTSRPTDPHELVGSPSYMAPEQLRSEEPTPQADLYAWGLIFLECLTGRPSVQAGSLQAIAAAHFGHEPIRLPAALQGHALCRVLELATAKDPTSRARSAADLLEQLEGLDPRTLPAVLDTDTCPPPLPLVQPGEKRQLALACCRLIAHGPGAEQLTVEDRDELVREALAVVAQREFRAHVTSVLGDRFVLAFGYPHARENDVLSATRAGLRLRAELQQLRWKHDGQYRIQLEIAVGVHVGAVVARARPGAAGALDELTGDTPEFALRMSERASAGEIWLSEAARERVRAHYVCTARGELDLPGRRAVPAFKLDRIAAPVGLPLRMHEQAHPLVGRDPELARLRARWQRVRSGGHTAWVFGDAGIGKSRLVRELQASLATESHQWLECACSDDATQTPLRPIADLVRAAITADDGDESAGLETLLIRSGLESSDILPHLGALLRLPARHGRDAPDRDAARSKELLLAAVRQLLFAMADREPLVVLIEDLHWADPSTCDFVGDLLAQRALAPIFLVLTFRPEFAPPWPAAGVLRLALAPLEPDDEHSMIAQRLGEAGDNPVLVRALAARAGGNPFFAEELARMTLETGLPDDPLEIPSTLQASLLARLDRLGGSKRIAETAAALGHEFSYPLIRAVADVDEHALLRDLSTLVEREILHQRGRLPQVRFAFRHALIREAAYQSLVRERRAELHARVARALREEFASSAEEAPELLAHHLEAAGLVEQAVTAWHRAGRLRAASSAHAEASEQLRRALALLERLPPSRERDERELEIQVAVCHSVGNAAGFASEALERALERTRELTTRVGSVQPTVSVLHGLSRFFQSRARYPESLEAAAMARSIAKGDAVMTQRVNITAAFTLAYMGQLAEAKVWLEQIVVEPGVDASNANAAGTWLAWILAYMGRPDRARQLLQRALADTNDRVNAVFARTIASDIDRYYGDHARAQESARLVVEQSQGRLPFWEATGLLFRGAALCELDQRVRGLDCARRGLDVWRAIGAQNGHSRFLCGAAEIHARAGDPDAAEALIQEAWQHVAATGESYYRAELLCVRARFAIGQPAADALHAEKDYAEAIACADQQGARLPQLLAAMQLCRLRRAQGRMSEARTALEPVLAHFAEGHTTPLVQEARELLG